METISVRRSNMSRRHQKQQASGMAQLRGGNDKPCGLAESESDARWYQKAAAGRSSCWRRQTRGTDIKTIAPG